MTEFIVKSTNRAKHETTHSILKEALDKEQKMLQAALKRTQEHLNYFEALYNLDSETFFAKYQKRNRRRKQLH